MSEKKKQPTRRQSAAIGQQRTRGADLLGWMQERAGAFMPGTHIRRRKVTRRGSSSIVKHTDDNRATRKEAAVLVSVKEPGELAKFRTRRGRRQSLQRAMRGGTNRPYVNPKRDAKSAASGRLRKELPS